MYHITIKYIILYLQSLLARGVSKCIKVNKPMFTNRQKVLHTIIRSPGIVVNVRNVVKNIRKITTQTAKGLFNFVIFS